MYKRQRQRRAVLGARSISLVIASEVRLLERVSKYLPTVISVRMVPVSYTHLDAVWHPKALYQEVVSNVGYVPQISLTGGKDPFIVENLLLPCWDIYCKWQADALNYLIKAH